MGASVDPAEALKPNPSNRFRLWQKGFLLGSALLGCLHHAALLVHVLPHGPLAIIGILAFNSFLYLTLAWIFKTTPLLSLQAWIPFYFLFLPGTLLFCFAIMGSHQPGFLVWMACLGLAISIFFPLPAHRGFHILMVLILLGCLPVYFSGMDFGLASSSVPQYLGLLATGLGLLTLFTLILGLEIALDNDRSELKELQKSREKQQIDAAIFRLFTNMAHEINNPLAIVAGYTDLLRHKAMAPKDASHPVPMSALQKMKEAHQRIKTLVEKLHQYGGQPHQPVTDRILILTLLADIKAHMGGVLSHANCRFTVEAASPYSYVSCDPINLTVALCELVENAVEALAGQNDKRIHLLINPQHSFTIFTLEDNGPGVPAGVIDEIFDPFFSTRSQDSSHKGLGLALASSIARQHRGYLIYEKSERLGGAKFILYIRNRLA